MAKKDLFQITDELINKLKPLKFSEPVTHVYNPLIYARESWDLYLKKYGKGKREIFLLGMNPGPWGMAQTGVPFGEIDHVKNWMGIEAPVGKPSNQHPKREIVGFKCTRSEVSGRRLWGWAKDRFGKADNFFKRFFVYNYCPLVFMEESSRNRTPDKLPVEERDQLLNICDEALRDTILYFDPTFVLGVGSFAQKRAEKALAGLNYKIGTILHPSPASPKANRGWVQYVEEDLRKMGIKF